MPSPAISLSYAIVGTSCALDSQGGHHGRDHSRFCASKAADPETARNRSRRLPRDAGYLCQQPDAKGRSRSRAGRSAAAPDHIIATQRPAMIAMTLTYPDLSPRQAPGDTDAVVE